MGKVGELTEWEGYLVVCEALLVEIGELLAGGRLAATRVDAVGGGRLFRLPTKAVHDGFDRVGLVSLDFEFEAHGAAVYEDA